MDLDDINVLLQVVEFGSVQAASRRLGIPRSTLRRRLQNLEAQVGGDLLVADATGVALTAAGAVIVEEGRLLLERSARMVSVAKASRNEATGTLRAILPIGLPNRVLVMILQMLRAAAPGLCIEQREYADPLSHLHEPFEFMLHFGPAPDRGEWFSRVLHRMSSVPLASQGYLDQAGRPTRVEDLANHTLISWRGPGWNPKEWPLRSGGTLPIEPMVIGNDPDVLHFAAQQGLGIFLGFVEPTFLPDSTPLVPVLDDVIGTELVVRSLSPVSENVDPRLRVVITNVQRFLEMIPR